MPRPLRDALQRFIRFKRRLGYSYGTVDHVLRPLDRWLGQQGLHTPSDVTPGHLEQWLAVRSGQVTRATLRKELSCLKLFYGFLSSRGEVPSDPTVTLPVMRVPQYVPFVFSVQQVRDLLSLGPEVFRTPETRILYYTLFHLLIWSDPASRGIREPGQGKGCGRPGGSGDSVPRVAATYRVT